MARTRKKKTYTEKDFKNGNGILTRIWGPSLWHFLHAMSFNYPTKPTHLILQIYLLFDYRPLNNYQRPKTPV